MGEVLSDFGSREKDEVRHFSSKPGAPPEPSRPPLPQAKMRASPCHRHVSRRFSCRDVFTFLSELAHRRVNPPTKGIGRLAPANACDLVRRIPSVARAFEAQQHRESAQQHHAARFRDIQKLVWSQRRIAETNLVKPAIKEIDIGVVELPAPKRPNRVRIRIEKAREARARAYRCAIDKKFQSSCERIANGSNVVPGIHHRGKSAVYLHIGIGGSDGLHTETGGTCRKVKQGLPSSALARITGVVPANHRLESTHGIELHKGFDREIAVCAGLQRSVH